MRVFKASALVRKCKYDFQDTGGVSSESSELQLQAPRHPHPKLWRYISIKVGTTWCVGSASVHPD